VTIYPNPESTNLRSGQSDRQTDPCPLAGKPASSQSCKTASHQSANSILTKLQGKRPKLRKLSTRWPRKVGKRQHRWQVNYRQGGISIANSWCAAKSRTVIVRLVSMAATGFFYTFTRPRTSLPMSMLKYDPISKPLPAHGYSLTRTGASGGGGLLATRIALRGMSGGKRRSIRLIAPSW
jgi:hypothetical protein